jgi:predicted dehydrogenase
VSAKLRVGVVGVGIIGQVMHLHFLRELSDRYEIVAICDLSLENATRCAREYRVNAVFTDWREMLSEPLDAVLILTSGSHAPLAIEAAKRGVHVFTEKPMCFSAVEATEMVEAARQANVTLMVGYPKRYDPAFARFKDEVALLPELKLFRVTTTESPFLPYVRHYPLTPPPSDVTRDVLDSLQKDSDVRLIAAIGTDDEFLVNQYLAVLLDTLVHETNTVRAILGEPLSLDYVDLRKGLATVVLNFGSTQAAIHWIETPDMTRYSMEFAMFATSGRVTLTFPSPYLRNAPTMLSVEGGEAGGASSWHREEVTSYESGFKQELVAFHDAVTEGSDVLTDGVDAARDIALCQAIIKCAQQRAPVQRPTHISAFDA